MRSLYFFCLFISLYVLCHYMKRLLLLLILFVTYAHALRAQDVYATFGVKGGHNALFGPFAAISAEAGYEAMRGFAISGGVQCSTIGRVVAEFRPRYFHDFDFGRLSGEVLLGYTYHSRMSNYIVGCGASLDIKALWATLGYYHRTITLAKDYICEPLNIYYELGVRCVPRREKWDLNIAVTNSRIFEVERHYQPSLVVDAWWYLLDRLSLLLGFNYMPAGMFNLSSDYGRAYANVGVCCRW